MHPTSTSTGSHAPDHAPQPADRTTTAGLWPWPWLNTGNLRPGDLIQIDDQARRVLNAEVYTDPHPAVPGALRVRITHTRFTPHTHTHPDTGPDDADTDPGTDPDTDADAETAPRNDRYTTTDVDTLRVLTRYQPARQGGIWHVTDTHGFPIPLPGDANSEADAWRLAVQRETQHREQQAQHAAVRLRIFADLSPDHATVIQDARELAARRDPLRSPATSLGAWTQVRRLTTANNAVQMLADWYAITDLNTDFLHAYAQGRMTAQGIVPMPGVILAAWGRPEGLRPRDRVTHIDGDISGCAGTGEITATGRNTHGIRTATVTWPGDDGTPFTHTSAWADLTITHQPTHA